MHRFPLRTLPVLLLTLVVLFCPGVSSAQESEDDSVHWAYSSFLGTGWYELDENREVYVLRVPIRWYYRDSYIDDSGQGQLGIEFHFPLTFGMHKLERLDDFVDLENIGTVSFNPGIEIEYPVSDRWLLRAYAHAGWGKEADSSDSAWIYDGGVKSRYSFQERKLEWAIVNELFFAGYNAKKSGKDGLTGVMAGLDFSYPLPTNLGSKNPLKINWDINYRWYENNPRFSGFLNNDASNTLENIPVTLEDEWQIGVAIAKQNGPFKIWFMNFQHLGLVYRFNTDGSFQAITFNFRSPFTR